MTGEPVGPWREVELTFTASSARPAPYRDVEVWAELRCGRDVLRRPAFWDGEDVWRVRFAPPHAGDWDWTVSASVPDPGLTGPTGTVHCRDGAPSGHPFYDQGFWRMSPSGRHVVHADALRHSSSPTPPGRCRGARPRSRSLPMHGTGRRRGSTRFCS